MNWIPAIGLEIHVQLSSKSKLFSGASTEYGAPANAQACAIDLGLPGVLPVINETAVRMAVKLGLAVNAEIAERSVFARKNYFYPDLPKGYQISQYELPIVKKGILEIILDDGSSKKIRITRAHLEEDAGKSVHEGFGDCSGIDLNRAGTPLIEIVSEPDIANPREAVLYMKKLHTLVRYLGISDGNMQEGSFRCDANVSVRPGDTEKLGTRTEIKNINSFRFVEMAIEGEIKRQKELLESGQQIIQETRLFDSEKNETRSMRSKEEANDYRYFPDPDLLPVIVTTGYIQEIRDELPELPDSKRRRFIREYGLTDYDSDHLVQERALAEYFEETVRSSGGEAKLSANWIMGELFAAMNRENLDIDHSPVTAAMLGGMIKRIRDNTISGKIAKQVFEAMWNGEGDADTIIKSRNLEQVTDMDAIGELVEEIIANSPDQVHQYRNSDPARQGKLIGYFVGQVMKKTGGKADPKMVNELLKDKLRGS